MPGFAFSRPHTAAVLPFPELAGLSLTGAITSRVVLRADRPLHLWTHELATGACIHAAASPVAHSFFVLEGNLRAGERTLAAGSAVLLEHQGSINLEALHATRVLHVFRPVAHPDRPTRRGGGVHLIGPAGSYGSRGPHPVVMYGDSTCPRCEIWLHRTAFGPNRQGGAHRHDADEILYVLQGSAVIGRDELPAGSALAVDAHTAYRLNSGPDGLVALNFRMNDPSYQALPRDGSVVPQVKDLEVIRERLAREGMAARD